MMGIVNPAREAEVPVINCLRMKKLGQALGKSIEQSAVRIYSADGAHDMWKKLLKRRGVDMG